MKILAVVVVALVIALSLYRIGSAVFDYELAMMDLNAPTINLKPSPNHRRLPEPQQRITCGIDACAQRTLVFI